MKIFTNSKIYLDNASSTPIDKKVFKLMTYCDKTLFANATSIHKSGVKVRKKIEESREKIASNIKAHKDEIFFTASSTESISIAIFGVVNNYKLENKNNIPHIITTEIEHPAVLNNFKLLEDRGDAEVTFIKVDNMGFVNPDNIRKAIKSNTVLISVMYANNEIGTIEPIQEIAKIIRHYRKYNPNISNYPYLHTDASQAMNYLYTENIEKLGVDMLSFNGSKIYGPKGIGILYKKRKIKLSPIYSGGEQEYGLRSGTENTSSIIGLAYAFEITNKIKKKEKVRLTILRDYAIDKLLSIKIKPFNIILNGDRKERLPNNINISITGISSELLVLELDSNGIEVSSRSACKSEDDADSYVIRSIRKIDKLKKEEGSIRITLGRSTNKSNINRLVYTLQKILEKYKEWK